MNIITADLCDQFPNIIEVTAPLFQAYGGKKRFAGQIATVKVYEDNSLVRHMLATAGEGRVLVVDGGGSTRCALVGDNLAQMALKNGWAGLIVYGCIRDTAVIETIPLGIRALHSCPRRSRKQNRGDANLAVKFAGVIFRPGHFVYVDEDGIIVAPHDLLTTDAEQ